MTLSVDVQNPTDENAKSVTVQLPAEVFDVPANVALIHQVVVAQLAAARQGTHKTKTRGEVRGGGAKPYRQKGTGRARQGSTRAPQYAGGGVVHGPVPRSYDQRTPKKMKAAALRGALSDRARNERVHVVSALVDGEVPSTKSAVAALAKISDAKHVLVVVERGDELTWKSVRNIPTVHLLEPGQLNTYDVLVSDDVVFTQGALEAFLAGPAKGNPSPTTSAGERTDAAGTPGASAKGAASSQEIVDLAKSSVDADADVTAVETVEDETAEDETAEPGGNAEVAELSSDDASDAAAAAGVADESEER
jgi:large subunit ribosomal protein L4